MQSRSLAANPVKCGSGWWCFSGGLFWWFLSFVRSLRVAHLGAGFSLAQHWVLFQLPPTTVPSSMLWVPLHLRGVCNCRVGSGSAGALDTLSQVPWVALMLGWIPADSNVA